MTTDERYFLSLERDLDRVLEVAQKARAVGLDPVDRVEIEIANELHERIVALFHVEALGERVRYWLEKTENKVETAFRVIAEIIPREGETPRIEIEGDDEYRAELALRVGMAIITDATVSAPIEGISKVAIKGSGRSSYLSVYYNGPIRTAGGTEGAISVLMADYIRQRLGLGRFVPTHEEVERYAEEVFLYKRVAHLQYNSEPEEVRRAVMNIPVEVTGPPTEKEEVSSFRNLPRVETNRIRGGAVLVINDCVIQKAKKMKKIIKQLKASVEDFDDSAWRWLGEEGGSRGGRGGELEKPPNSGCPVVKPSYKYLKDAVMGRPILAHPSRVGGFRLRYGRSRNTGLASIGMNPATMYVLDSFVAVGTQVRTERPGKSAVVMPVDWIEGPTVRLRDGSVIRIDHPDEAKKLSDSIERILHLGDVLVGFGEFLENNHRLLPSAWVEEWWYALLEARARELGAEPPVGKWEDVSFTEAIEISKKFGVPLHPRYTYFWEHVTVSELISLLRAVREGTRSPGALSIRASDELKEILEKLGITHRVGMGMIWVEGDDASLLEYLASSVPLKGGVADLSEYDTIRFLNEHLDVTIMPKGPTKIGMRVGRPEKAKPRKMKPPVNLLFPVGELKGMTRSLEAAYNQGKVEVEVAIRTCPKCGTRTTRYRCPKCGTRTVPSQFCPVCGKRVNGRCRDHPNAKPVPYTRTTISIRDEVDEVLSELGEDKGVLKKVKGVKGLTSGSKSPEVIEKGILRGKYGLFVFKDGTIRFDAVNAALTHFKPLEVGVPVSKLRELGYTRDVNGEELVDEDQLLELKVQDIVIPREAGRYLFMVSKYVDELLEKVYGLEPFYKLESEEDLVGHLVLTISPHTFVANVARIIGFTDADVLFAHPFLHAAKRRNIDGDEDSIMLALDGLMNFSREFLPSTPGGREDAPLLMVTRVDPEYIDDEVYNMEVVYSLPPAFYEATYQYEDPGKLKDVVPTVETELSRGVRYPEVGYSVPTSHVYRGPLRTTYRKLGKMEEKMRAHFSLEEKIAAVDKMDALSRAISSHFLRDIVGNLRKFGQQTFRCTKCNAKYRRPPLSGRCLMCGGPIQLTVHRGTVLKYLEPTLSLLREYGIEGYLSQRIRVIEAEAKSLFREDSEPSNTLESLLEDGSPGIESRVPDKGEDGDGYEESGREEEGRGDSRKNKEKKEGRSAARKLVDFL